MLTTDVPLNKAARFLKLLVDSDLGSFRDHIEGKLKENEDFLKSLEGEGTSAPKSVVVSTKSECLVIYDLMAKVDKMFEARAKAEARENQKREKAKHSKLQKILMEGGHKGGRGFGG